MQTTEHIITERISALSDDERNKVARYIERLVRKRDEPKTLFDKIDELWADVPDEVWDKIPRDGSEQHDHYIYGTPKR